MPKKEIKSNFGEPGAYAMARNQAGGDWAAGLLLYRLKWRWQSKTKLKRLGNDWIAMSRSDWAREAGLSDGEIKNRALPKLRKRQFVTIRAMRLGNQKLLWMSLNLAKLHEWTTAPEIHEVLLNGGVPPATKRPPVTIHISTMNWKSYKTPNRSRCDGLWMSARKMILKRHDLMTI
jgi:hypothetical protein